MESAVNIDLANEEDRGEGARSALESTKRFQDSERQSRRDGLVRGEGIEKQSRRGARRDGVEEKQSR